jgi:hypothetical protein
VMCWRCLGDALVMMCRCSGDTSNTRWQTHHHQKHQNITNAFPTRSQHIAGASPKHRQHITKTAPQHDQDIARKSPKHRQQITKNITNTYTLPIHHRNMIKPPLTCDQNIVCTKTQRIANTSP